MNNKGIYHTDCMSCIHKDICKDCKDLVEYTNVISNTIVPHTDGYNFKEILRAYDNISIEIKCKNYLSKDQLLTASKLNRPSLTVFEERDNPR